MDFEEFLNRVRKTISDKRPAENTPVVLISSNTEGTDNSCNHSPNWQKGTKTAVIAGLLLIGIICIFQFRSMITPMIFACLMVFYLKPVVFSIQNKWNISHKWSVIIVYSLILIAVLLIIFICGYSIYGQALNFVEFLNKSIENLPEVISSFFKERTGGPGNVSEGIVGIADDSEIRQTFQSIMRYFSGTILSIAQGFTSKIGWFFFIYGFSFFVLWEMKKGKKTTAIFKFSGYEKDIDTAKQHLSLIWRSFLWGQLFLLLISLVVYFALYIVLGVKYSFILSIAVGLTRMIPYIGSFFAWGIVALVAFFQGSTILGFSPFMFSLFVVTISFIVDKLMDGFVQPKFLAETLKIHPAAVLTAALICGRTMGFLGIFISAPLVATLKLFLKYVVCKLNDEDPWENIEKIPEPLPFIQIFASSKQHCKKIYDKLIDSTVSIKNHLFKKTGGKEHGSNGLEN